MSLHEVVHLAIQSAGRFGSPADVRHFQRVCLVKCCHILIISFIETVYSCVSVCVYEDVYIYIYIYTYGYTCKCTACLHMCLRVCVYTRLSFPYFHSPVLPHY